MMCSHFFFLQIASSAKVVWPGQLSVIANYEEKNKRKLLSSMESRVRHKKIET